jgi:hypothetical protein
MLSQGMKDRRGRNAFKHRTPAWWRAGLLVSLALAGATGCESGRGEVGTTLLASNLGLKTVARDNRIPPAVQPNDAQPVAGPTTSTSSPVPAEMALPGEPAPLAAPPMAPRPLFEPSQGAAESPTNEPPTYAEPAPPEQPATSAEAPLREPAPAQAAPPQEAEWVVSRGSTLRRTLERWGRTASREIVYQLPEDMAVDVDGRFEGTFDEALAWLLRGFDSARPRPIARVRSNAVLIQGSKDDLGGEARS